MKVFVDTGAFLALFIYREIDHTKVARRYKSYREQNALLITSYYILDELFTRLIYDYGKQETKRVMDVLEESVNKNQLRVLEVDENIISHAKASLLKFSEHKLSFTDATTYALCKELALDEVFTLDSGFKKVGLKTSF